MGNREMGGDTGRLREEVSRRLREAGFCAVGFAKVGKVCEETMRGYDEWLAKGYNSEMHYMENHRAIRKDPGLLLEGARTIVCCAFCYSSGSLRDPDLPTISSYAFLPDYHIMLRNRIRESCVGDLLGEEGKDWRICVDSAPIFERYWAEKSGIGRIGENGMLSVPGAGCEVFLAEIVTVLDLGSEEGAEVGKKAADEGCNGCGRCHRACPTGALQSDGTIDCNRCLSYLTIEHRGEWTDPVHLQVMQSEAGRSTLFGCDRCIACCPLKVEEARIDTDTLMAGIVNLTVDDIFGDEAETKARIQGSSLKRAKIEGLARNALNCKR